VSEYFHPFFHRVRTGRNKILAALNFDHTNAAGTGGGEGFHVAQCGHRNAISAQSFQNRIAAFRFDDLIIYFDIENHSIVVVRRLLVNRNFDKSSCGIWFSAKAK
jgi:hypothetical protein